MKDIERLKRIIENYNEESEKYGFLTVIMSLDKDDIQAIDHIITRLKYLEEAESCHREENGRLQEKITEYENQLDLDYVDKNYIPKEKVREKMKKDEWAYKSYDSSMADYRQSQAIGRYMACLELLQEER